GSLHDRPDQPDAVPRVRGRRELARPRRRCMRVLPDRVVGGRRPARPGDQRAAGRRRPPPGRGRASRRRDRAPELGHPRPPRGGGAGALVPIPGGVGGVGGRRGGLARQIPAGARGLGLSADPSAVQSLLVIPGATVTAEVLPFWRAVLGYEPRRDSPDEDLFDPRSRGPSFWFEQMHEPRPGAGGAIHVAIWVPYEQAEAPIAAALAPRRRTGRDP